VSRVADSADRQDRPRFVNWKAMEAVLLAACQDPRITLAYFRLLMEVAAWSDPETGWCRRTLRQLAKAVHYQDTGTVRRWLGELQDLGYLERRGSGRPGYPDKNGRNTEAYRLRGLCQPPLMVARGLHQNPHEGSPRAQGEGSHRAQGEGSHRAQQKKERRTEGAASPAPSRGRSGKAAQRPDPADNGRVQINDRSYRNHGPPTGMPQHIKAMLAQTKRDLAGEGTVHQLREPGREGPPAHEATSA
jgi:hypothetical protein